MGMFDEVRAVSKKSQTEHKRNKPKAKARGEFSQKTINDIHTRDGKRCVCCRSYKIEPIPHHIIFRSSLGKGTKDNGATICPLCHLWAHGRSKGPNGEPTKEGRKWFENWRDENLDENGDLKHD